MSESYIQGLARARWEIQDARDLADLWDEESEVSQTHQESRVRVMRDRMLGDARTAQYILRDISDRSTSKDRSFKSLSKAATSTIQGRSSLQPLQEAIEILQRSKTVFMEAFQAHSLVQLGAEQARMGQDLYRIGQDLIALKQRSNIVVNGEGNVVHVNYARTSQEQVFAQSHHRESDGWKDNKRPIHFLWNLCVNDRLQFVELQRDFPHSQAWTRERYDAAISRLSLWGFGVLEEPNDLDSILDQNATEFVLARLLMIVNTIERLEGSDINHGGLNIAFNYMADSAHLQPFLAAMELSLSERIAESEQETLSEDSDWVAWQTGNLHFLEENVDRLYDVLPVERSFRLQQVLRLESLGERTAASPFANESRVSEVPARTVPVDERTSEEIAQEAEEATKLITTNLEQLQELQDGMDSTPISFVSLEKSVRRLEEWKKEADLKRLTRFTDIRLITERQNDLNKSLGQGLFKLQEKTDKFSRDDYEKVAQALNAALAALDENEPGSGLLS